MERGIARVYVDFLASLYPGLRRTDGENEAGVLTRFIRDGGLSEGDLVADGFSGTECIRQDSGFVKGKVTASETYSPFWSGRVG